MSADSFFFGLGATVGGVSAINLTSGWSIIAALFFVLQVAILGGFAALWIPDWYRTLKRKRLHRY